jgi:ABC-type branched-subunit amino acid transport system substrate-binding protein
MGMTQTPLMRGLTGWLIVVVLLGMASAQSLNVRVIVPLSGQHAAMGQAQQEVLEAYVRRNPSVYGIPFDITFLDSQSDPERVVALLAEQEDAHAIICCHDAAVARAVFRAYSDQNSDLAVPIISLASATGIGQVGQLPAWLSPYWMFSVVPDESVILRSMLLNMTDKGVQRLGVMGLEGDFGEVAVTAFERMLAPGSMAVVVSERYPPNVSVLTPEALWVATRLPDAVLVWGLPADTRVAFDALRRRGYEGAIYLNPNLYTRSGVSFAAFEGAYTVLDNITANNLQRPAAQQFRLATRRTASPATLAAARAWDALIVLDAALSEALRGADVDDVTDVRQRLRDAIISVPPIEGATATFDFREGDPVGIDARSLVTVKVTDGVLRPELNHNLGDDLGEARSSD